jgi:hypothetical protein
VSTLANGGGGLDIFVDEEFCGGGGGAAAASAPPAFLQPGRRAGCVGNACGMAHASACLAMRGALRLFLWRGRLPLVGPLPCPVQCLPNRSATHFAPHPPLGLLQVRSGRRCLDQACRLRGWAEGKRAARRGVGGAEAAPGVSAFRARGPRPRGLCGPGAAGKAIFIVLHNVKAGIGAGGLSKQGAGCEPAVRRDGYRHRGWVRRGHTQSLQAGQPDSPSHTNTLVNAPQEAEQAAAPAADAAKPTLRQRLDRGGGGGGGAPEDERLMQDPLQLHKVCCGRGGCAAG